MAKTMTDDRARARLATDRELVRRQTRLSLGAALRAAYAGRSTQSEIAAALGIAQNTVSRWTTGEVEPSLADVQAIEEFCGLPHGHILRAAGFVTEAATPEDLIATDNRLDRPRRELLLAAYKAALDQTRA